MGKAMARNTRRSNGMKKIQPAQETLTFYVPAGISYVDLSLAASIANRRGYKQQDSDWMVAGFTLYAVNPTANPSSFNIYKAPNTWVVDNAYTKSKAMWEKMNDQVLDDEPGIQGKWSDFKVHIDHGMVGQSVQCAADPLGKILTPLTEQAPAGAGTGLIQVPAVGQVDSLTTADFTGAALPRAEWNYSTIQIPNDPASGTTTEYSLHLIGPNQADSKSLIVGYARSRTRDTERDPNVPITEGWMNELFDLGENNEEIRDDLVADNDRAPYALYPSSSGAEGYPGGSTEQIGLVNHSTQPITSTTVGGKTTIRGGQFKCGLMKFNLSGEVSGALLQIHLVPGMNRGYMC